MSRGTSERPTWPRRVITSLAIMGPAFIAGAWQFGPGALTTAVQAGNQFGYHLLWVIVLSTVLAIVFTDMSARIGLRSGTSIIQTAKDTFGTAWGALSGVGVFLITLIFSVGNAVGTGLGLAGLFGGPPMVWTIIASAAVAFVVFAKNVYRIIERLLIAMVAVMALGFVISALMTDPAWSSVATGLVLPTVPAGAELLVVALVGTNFSINAAFYVSYAIRERKLTEQQFREVRWRDTVPGIAAPGLMAVFVIVAAVATSRHGLEANTLQELGQALEPVAGPIASTLFSLGFFAAAFSSMTANAVASGTVLSDALGLGDKLASAPVKTFILIPLIFGATVMIVAGGNPIQLIVTAQALIVLVAPYVGLVVVLLASRRALMGRLVNGVAMKSAGVVGILVLLAMSGRLVLSWFS
ncbi:Nramp family divalent metal transporter [Nesterenkonia sp. K-15-9-6]|uniref:Nramp family divalent metal transporter n=1 Tax=Nesterenkonia sp. K-15-9-6 TaxID=3093918 RepID=UPI0040442F3A